MLWRFIIIFCFCSMCCAQEELDKTQLTLLKNAFDAFDHEKKGIISTDMIGTILEMLGHEIDDDALKEIIEEVDEDESVEECGPTYERVLAQAEAENIVRVAVSFNNGSGELEFSEFCKLAAQFLTEDDEPDSEAMVAELREAFRLYDKEGNGYITTDVLREIFKELDSTIPKDDLDAMIEDIDSDGSGTVDFEEFLEVMTGE